MATVTRAIVTCDVCGNANDVQTQAFGLDGKSYEIDLCPEDGDRLSKVAARYIRPARKVAARRRPRHNGRRPRSRGEPVARAAGAREETRAGRSRPRKAETASKQKAKTAPKQEAETAPKQQAETSPKHAAKATGSKQEKGIYVYGILPADIEVTADIPGVGERPGRLDVVRADGLAALISVVDQAGRLGSPEDLRTHKEILDSTAIEVPVVPLRFGTVLTSEAAVANELLTPHHDEFAADLEHLEGRAEFLVKGRYADESILGEAITARREEDTETLRQAMEGVCVGSAVMEPGHDLDAFHVAFLVAVDDESDVERVVEDLARQWEGRIEVQLLGPMAAYDFAGPDTEGTPAPASGGKETGKQLLRRR